MGKRFHVCAAPRMITGNSVQKQLNFAGQIQCALTRTHNRERQPLLLISPWCLQQLFQFFDRFGVLRADWVISAARVRSLQSTIMTRVTLGWNQLND